MAAVNGHLSQSGQLASSAVAVHSVKASALRSGMDVHRPSNAKAFTKGRPGQYFRYNNLNVCSVLRM